MNILDRKRKAIKMLKENIGKGQQHNFKIEGPGIVSQDVDKLLEREDVQQKLRELTELFVKCMKNSTETI